MTNQRLIDRLSAEVTPVAPNAFARDMSRALLLGAAVTLIIIQFAFGTQAGLTTVAGAGPLLMKSAYGLTLAAMAFALTLVLHRPESRSGGWYRLVSPVAGLGLLATYQLATGPPGASSAMLLGSSWAACPWRIACLSLPVFAGLISALRKQAPTRLRTAGAAAGLLSGSVAAMLYALACTESSAVFVLVWYSLGIALATLFGALLGPRLLRW